MLYNYKSPSRVLCGEYCLRAIRNGDQSTQKKFLQTAQSTWKSEGFCPWFPEVLRNVEKDFAKYANIYFVERISNCCIKILPASLTFTTRSISLRFYKII